MNESKENAKKGEASKKGGDATKEATGDGGARKSDTAHTEVYGSATPAPQKENDVPARANTDESKAKDAPSPAVAVKDDKFSFSNIKHALENRGKQLLGVDRPHKTAENADKMTPEARAQKGVTDYFDKKTGRQFRYDEQGRINEIESKGGLITTIVYGEGSDATKPKAIAVVDNSSWNMVAHLEATDGVQLRIDQKTGNMVAAYRETLRTVRGDTPLGTELHVRHEVSPDGHQSVTRSTMDGLRVDRTLMRNDGTAYGSIEYQYLTPQNGQSPKDMPVVAVQLDECNRPVETKIFDDAQRMELDKPRVREEISYAERGGSLVETHERFDLEDGVSRLDSRCVKTLDLQQGIQSVVLEQIRGGKTIATTNCTLDATGKPVGLEYKDSTLNCELQFSFDEIGKPVKVHGDTTGLLPEDKLLAFAFLSVATLKNEYKVGTLTDREAREDLAPTPPREGDHDTGVLVWKEGAGYAHGRVDKGIIYDKSDTAIGTMKDNGEVALSGPPPRTFNIVNDKDAGAGFHGLGSDGERLDLCAGQGDGVDRHEGLNGLFARYSPDGVPSGEVLVVGGNMFDEHNQFIGHVDEFGKVTFPNDREPRQDAGTDLNSILKDGYVFNGNQNGKPLQFDVDNLSTGRIFIPQLDAQTGQPKLDANGNLLPPMEYAIRLGAVIDTKSGEQIAKYVPPADLGDRLEGGSLVMGNPPRVVPLGSIQNLVFDVHVQGQASGRTVSGLSLGPGDGPDGYGGGLINLNHSLALTAQWHDEAVKQSGGTEEDKVTIDLSVKAQTRARALHDEIVTTGVVTPDVLRKLNSQMARDNNLLAGDDSLIRLRSRMDHPVYKLESITGPVDGYGWLPDAKSKDGVARVEIKQNLLYKPGSDNAIGSIDPRDGSLKFLDARGQVIHSNMKEVPGAVWHFTYQKDGKQEESNWFTTRGGHIRSEHDLKEKMQSELNYASQIHNQSKTEEAGQALDRTIKLTIRYRDELDKAVKEGIPVNADGTVASGSALELVEGGPRQFVRAEHYREKQPPPTVLPLKELTAEQCTKTNGTVRLGEDLFKIEQGKLRRMSMQDGQLVAGDLCGSWEPNYKIKVDGREIDLRNQNQVIIEFKTAGDDHQYRIFGRGHARTEADGRFNAGGLVDADQVIQEMRRAKDAAENGNMQYFREKSWVLGTTANWYKGDQEGQMDAILSTIEKEMGAANKEVSQLFGDGLELKITNNHLDHNTVALDRFCNDMNVSSQDVLKRAGEATQTQKQADNVAVITLVSIVTAGAGSAVSAAGLTGMTAVGTELGVSVVGGGLVSGMVRHREQNTFSQDGMNVLSGGMEALAMAGGGRLAQLGKELQALKAAKVAGTLTPQQAEMLARYTMLSRTVDVMSRNRFVADVVPGLVRPTNAMMQSTLFMGAHALREPQSSEFTVQNWMMSSTWMLGGEYASATMRGLTSWGKLTEPQLLAVQKAGGTPFVPQWHMTSPLGRFGEHMAEHLPTNAVNNFFYGGLDAAPQAVQAERMRVSEKTRLPVEIVSDEFMARHGNYYNIFADMQQAALDSALTAPVVTAGSYAGKLGVEIVRDVPVHVWEQKFRTAQNKAEIDPATGAPNKPGIQRQLLDYIEEYKRRGTVEEDGTIMGVDENGKRVVKHKPPCLLNMDVTKLGELNSAQGKEQGDKVLKLISETIQARTRTEDTFGRFGGDEYVTILRDCLDPAAAGRPIAELKCVAYPGQDPFILRPGETFEPFLKDSEGNLVQDAEGNHIKGNMVTVTVGAVYWKPGQSVSEFIEASDAAMYKNKQAGHSNQILYDQSVLPPPELPTPAQRARENQLGFYRELNERSKDFRSRRLTDGEVRQYKQDLVKGQEIFAKLAVEHPAHKLLTEFYTDIALEKEVAHAKRHKQEPILLKIDPNNFKVVNDGAGHAAGDDVLLRAGDYIRDITRQGDFLGSQGLAGLIIARHTNDVSRLQTEAGKFLLAVGPDGVRPIKSMSELREVSLDGLTGKTLEVFEKRKLEVPVSFAVGVAKYEPGMNVEQWKAAVEESLKECKTRQMLSGERLPRTTAEEALLEEYKRTANPMLNPEGDTGKPIDISNLSEHQLKTFLEGKLKLRERVKNADGTETVIDHPLIREEVMDDFITRSYDVMKKWPAINQMEDRAIVDAVLKKRTQELAKLASEFGNEHGLPPINIVVNDKLLIQMNSRATHLAGTNTIFVRSSDLLRPDPEFIGVVYHEFFHAEQDKAMLNATAVDLLQRVPPEERMTALSNIKVQYDIVKAYLDATGKNSSGDRSTELGWAASVLSRQDNRAWIAERVNLDAEGLKEDTAYARADKLRSSFKQGRDYSEKMAIVQRQISELPRLCKEELFGDDPDKFLERLHKDPAFRTEIYGYDLLSAKFDKRDAVFNDLLQTNPEFGLAIQKGQREQWMAKLGEISPEMPRSNVMLTRLELKGLLHMMQKDGWKLNGDNYQLYDDRLRENLSTVLDDAHQRRHHLTFTQYEGTQAELETFFVMKQVQRKTKERSISFH